MRPEERITQYLANGGLFNPELMANEATRDLLRDCRSEIERLREQCGHYQDALVAITLRDPVNPIADCRFYRKTALDAVRAAGMTSEVGHVAGNGGQSDA